MTSHDETELRLRRQIDALQTTCDERAELLVKAHNALIPLAQWEKPVNPTAKDCILAGEIKQAIAEMIPMIPKT